MVEIFDHLGQLSFHVFDPLQVRGAIDRPHCDPQHMSNLVDDYLPRLT